MQTVAMVLVQIRDVDADVRDRLKQLAAEQGSSLNAFLRDLLTRQAELPLRSEVIRRLRDRGDLLPPGEGSSSADDIRAAREEREEQLVRAADHDRR